MNPRIPRLPIVNGRTRFGRDIVAEFWMPRKPSGRAIILCDGCPSLPHRHKVGEFFARKGYWVFHPRYRGSWESGGMFLKESPDQDVIQVARALNGGFTDIMTEQTYFLDISDITVIGSSFGGAAAILSLADPMITRAVALSPLIDWSKPGRAEPFTLFTRILSEGFGGAYRVHKDAWKKIQDGHFYNPATLVTSIDPDRVCIIHALDDEVIPVAPLRAFAKKFKVRPIYHSTGGHFSVRAVTTKELWDIVAPFLKRNR